MNHLCQAFELRLGLLSSPSPPDPPVHTGRPPFYKSRYDSREMGGFNERARLSSPLRFPGPSVDGRTCANPHGGRRRIRNDQSRSDARARPHKSLFSLRSAFFASRHFFPGRESECCLRRGAFEAECSVNENVVAMEITRGRRVGESSGGGPGGVRRSDRLLRRPLALSVGGSALGDGPISPGPFRAGGSRPVSAVRFSRPSAPNRKCRSCRVLRRTVALLKAKQETLGGEPASGLARANFPREDVGAKTREIGRFHR